MGIRRVVLAIGLSIGSTAAQGHAQDADPAAGQNTFVIRCSQCHDITAGVNKSGPTLKGVVGRTAGTAPDYPYSDAMRAAGFVWGEEQFKAYLVAPKTVVPKNKMNFNGIKRPGELEPLVAYLMVAGAP
mgnify:CR=1 FL=1